MFITVVVSFLLINGLFALEKDDSTSGRTFEHFEESQWNPVNWFGSHEDRNQIKLDALYKVVNCISVKEKQQCNDLLKDARFKFEKWVKHPKPAAKPTVEETTNNTEKSPTSDSTPITTSTTSSEFSII